jgi:hypothetical protein
MRFYGRRLYKLANICYIVVPSGDLVSKIVWLPNSPEKACPFTEEELSAFNDVAQRCIKEGIPAMVTILGYPVIAARTKNEGEYRKCTMLIKRNGALEVMEVLEHTVRNQDVVIFDKTKTTN